MSPKMAKNQRARKSLRSKCASILVTNEEDSDDMQPKNIKRNCKKKPVNLKFKEIEEEKLSHNSPVTVKGLNFYDNGRVCEKHYLLGSCGQSLEIGDILLFERGITICPHTNDAFEATVIAIKVNR